MLLCLALSRGWAHSRLKQITLLLPISPGSHVLWAPLNSFLDTFPGLANAFLRAIYTDPGSAAWAEVQRQLSIVVVALEGAAATLRPVADL